MIESGDTWHFEKNATIFSFFNPEKSFGNVLISLKASMLGFSGGNGSKLYLKFLKRLSRSSFRLLILSLSPSMSGKWAKGPWSGVMGWSIFVPTFSRGASGISVGRILRCWVFIPHG